MVTTVTGTLLAATAAAQAPDCRALEKLQLEDVRITEAKPIGTADLPRDITAPHCLVSGVIGREIRFTAWLPDQWNKRFAMGGGGGFVGSIQNQALTSLNQGYATAGTDTGHQGVGIQARWALGNPERQLNYGHVAVHRVAEAVKAIIRAHYGSPPEYSYFSGCSNGGRQALMEAERYPADFDGIVSGAPAYDFTRIATSFIRNIQTAFPDPTPTPVVTEANLALLDRAVLAACDRADGVADEVLGDPSACRFAVTSVPVCPADRSGPDCLTKAQRTVLERIYQPTRVAGRQVYPGQPFGGEGRQGGWAAWITGPGTAQVPSLHYSFGTEFFKYLVFGDSTWDYRRYDLANAERDTRATAAFLNADAADLGRFKARRGRLILWHGWSDPALNGYSTISYHDRLARADPSFRDYVRLFMLPGVLHCAGGPGPDTVDWLEAISAWVERGEAPTKLIARKKATGTSPAKARPLCVHPERAVYRGSGDPNAAESYSCSAR
jgi:feruloyl esterase